jgi:hypothetical protein
VNKIKDKTNSKTKWDPDKNTKSSKLTLFKRQIREVMNIRNIKITFQANKTEVEITN